MSGPVDNVQELLKTVGMTRREAVDKPLIREVLR